MKKPIIGIVYRNLEDENKVKVNFAVEGIRKAVIAASGIPFLILDVSKDGDFPNLKQIFDLCDGFILPGGDSWYQTDEEVINYCLDNDKPLLGICLGMQVLGKMLSKNKSVFGDTTIKNNTNIDHCQLGVDFVHNVEITNNTKLFKIIGSNNIMVNSRHNFHISDIDSKYISAVSIDGIVEAIEVPDKKFIIGVQWHPEDLYEKDLNSLKLFEAFILSTVG